MICVHDFPHGDVSVKVGVTKFALLCTDMNLNTSLFALYSLCNTTELAFQLSSLSLLCTLFKCNKIHLRFQCNLVHFCHVVRNFIVWQLIGYLLQKLPKLLYIQLLCSICLSLLCRYYIACPGVCFSQVRKKTLGATEERQSSRQTTSSATLDAGLPRVTLSWRWWTLRVDRLRSRSQ